MIKIKKRFWMVAFCIVSMVLTSIAWQPQTISAKVIENAKLPVSGKKLGKVSVIKIKDTQKKTITLKPNQAKAIKMELPKSHYLRKIYNEGYYRDRRYYITASSQSDINLFTYSNSFLPFKSSDYTTASMRNYGKEVKMEVVGDTGGIVHTVFYNTTDEDIVIKNIRIRALPKSIEKPKVKVGENKLTYSPKTCDIVNQLHKIKGEQALYVRYCVFTPDKSGKYKIYIKGDKMAVWTYRGFRDVATCQHYSAARTQYFKKGVTYYIKTSVATDWGKNKEETLIIQKK